VQSIETCGVIVCSLRRCRGGNKDYQNAAILKNIINPLALAPMCIHCSDLSASVAENDNIILQHIGNFLVSQFQAKYEWKEVTIRGLDGKIALTKLSERIIAYSKGAWPFNHPLTDDTDILK
jgi:hypothetical protein